LLFLDPASGFMPSNFRLCYITDRRALEPTPLLVYFLSLDEAYDGVARDRMFYFGQLLKEAGAPRLQYRVDGWYPRRQWSVWRRC
jgi:hypothetical protein